MGPTTYDLYAVLVHQGASTRSGHYYAFIKNNNGVWYKMDDDSVTQARDDAEPVFVPSSSLCCAPF